MQLTGKQIIERGIISNYVEEGIQQQGVDVRVAKIIKLHPHLDSKAGYVPVEGKTKIGGDWQEVQPSVRPLAENPKPSFMLSPGYYEVTLMESCKMPANAALHYMTRSSLVRNGATVYSGQFDGGFETDAMGCYLEVRQPLIIEVGARIAQAIVNETYEVENTYNGQWQGDKQRVK